MVLLSSVVCFALISLVFPIPLQRHTEEQDAWNRKRYSHKMDYPVYMMQLYQSLIMGNGTDFPGLEHPVLQESDMVLSLTAKSCREAGNLWRMSFDMSSISSTAELMLAELRIRLPLFEKARNITVEIYHSKDGRDKLFIGSFWTNPSAAKGNSWKIFNLTRILQYSIHHGEPILNPGYIAAEDRAEQKAEPGDIRELRQAPHNADPLSAMYFTVEKVMLVVFARERSSASHLGSPSLIKTVQSSKYIMTERATKVVGVRRHRRNHNSQYNMIINNLPSKIEAGAPLCRRVDMWVEFEKIEWGNRIIYPRKYNAYRCEGTCPIPLNETFKPTNHAFIKSLVKMHDSEKVECSSCIPVKMSALSMLIYEDIKVSLKHHEDMVVEECGCN